MVYDSIANGSCFLWDSLDSGIQLASTGSMTDPFAEEYGGIAVSPDDQFLALDGYVGNVGYPANVGSIIVCKLDSQFSANTGENASGLPDVMNIENVSYTAHLHQWYYQYPWGGLGHC